MKRNNIVFEETPTVYELVIVDIDRELIYLNGDEQSTDGFMSFPELVNEHSETLTSELLKFCENLGFSLEAYQQLDFPDVNLEYSYIDETPGLIKRRIPILAKVSIINDKDNKCFYPIANLPNLDFEIEVLINKTKRTLGWI